ncbi:MAG: ATP-binding cassette domain-containing protein [Tyzzerella sp.]|nr:ATP-binding cassette domain-containing protein [Tyzzerella sp.]
MYIEINNYTKILSKTTVLNDISIKMDKGKVYGFQGCNGSGKTMLMRAICGLISPTKGEVIIDNKPLSKKNSFPDSVGILIENPGFLSYYSGFKNLKIIAQIKNMITDETIRATMSKLGLDPYDNKKYGKYSLGMKQKLGIAAAIMEEPEIIILDEPFNALDEKSVTIVGNEILNLRNKNKLIILACHDSKELEYLCDEIFVIENGKIKDHRKFTHIGDYDNEEK